MGRSGKIGIAAAALIVTGMLFWALRQGVPTPVEPPGMGGRPAEPGEAPAPILVHPTESSAVEGDGVVFGRLVRGAESRPVLGAVSVNERHIPLRTAESGRDGRFRLEGLPRWKRFALRVEAPGVLPASFPGWRIPETGVLDVGDLVLGAACRLTVLVSDRTGRSLKGAAVSLHRPPGETPRDFDEGWALLPAATPPEAAAKTDAGGAASLDVPPGRWTVVVAAEGFARRVVSVSLGEGVVPDLLHIVLQPACALGGTVTGADGRPRAGVTVLAGASGQDRATGFERTEAVTGQDGGYRLEGLSPGRQVLEVQVAQGIRWAAGAVVVPEVERFDIRLPEGAALRGRVVDDSDGTPLTEALVRFTVYSHLHRTIAAFVETRSGPDGEFLIGELPPGAMGRIAVRREGYVPFPDGRPWPHVGTLAAGRTARVEVRLCREAVLRGRVASPGGAPVPGARVVFLWWGGGVQASPAAMTASDGSYEISAAAPSRGLLRVEAEGWCQPGFPLAPQEALRIGKLPEAWVAEAAAGREAKKDIILARAGVVEGVVVDGEGKPAPGFLVLVGGRSDPPPGPESAGAFSGPAGGFRLGSVAMGEDLVARALGPLGAGGCSDPFRLEAGGMVTGVQISIGSGATLVGSVLREDGQPPAGATVLVATGGFDLALAWQAERFARTSAPHPVDPGGSFRIEGLAAGKYTLKASATGYAPVALPPLDVGQGELMEDLRFLLPAEGRIGGVVRGEDGSPIPGASVATLAETGTRLDANYTPPGGLGAGAVTGSDGRFEIRELAPGNHQVVAWARGFPPVTAKAAAGTEDLDIVLHAGLSITGTVVDEEAGGPVPDIDVTAFPGSQAPGRWSTSSGTSGEDGVFFVGDLAPGDYRLSARPPPLGDDSWEYRGADVRGVEAGATGVRIQLRRGLVIAGRILDAEGRLLNGQVRIQYGPTGSAGLASGTSQTGGAFRLRGLDPGSYDIRVEQMALPGQGGVAPTTVVCVPAGTTGLIIAVGRGPSIEGMVKDEAGRPPPQGGRLLVRPSGSEGNPESVALLPDGRFWTQPLEAGRTYDIVARDWPGLMGGSRGVPAETKDLVIVLGAGNSISGSVVDEVGNPVSAGVPVTASASRAVENEPGARASTATDAKGEFRIGGLGDFPFKLTAGRAGTDHLEGDPLPDVLGGTTGVVLRTLRGYALSGRLLDDAGSPLRNVIVGGTFTVSGGSGRGRTIRTDEEGRFVFSGIPSGKITLSTGEGADLVWCGTYDVPCDPVDVVVPTR